MTAFSTAIDRIFADPNMAVDAVWKSRGVGAAVSCRLILKRPDDFRDFGGAQVVSSTVIADVRVSDIAGAEDPVRKFIPGVDLYAEAALGGYAELRQRTILDGVGHWVQQEAPAATNEALERFLNGL